MLQQVYHTDFHSCHVIFDVYFTLNQAYRRPFFSYCYFSFSLLLERLFHKHTCTVIIIITIKRISRVPIYHTKWQHRVLYNNTNYTHTHTHTHTHTQAVHFAYRQIQAANYQYNCIKCCCYMSQVS